LAGSHTWLKRFFFFSRKKDDIWCSSSPVDMPADVNPPRCRSVTPVEVGLGGDERTEVPSLRALSFVIEDTIVRRLYVLQRVGELEELSNDGVVGCGSEVDGIKENFSSNLDVAVR
jgi:hypothetical protein